MERIRKLIVPDEIADADRAYLRTITSTILIISLVAMSLLILVGVISRYAYTIAIGGVGFVVGVLILWLLHQGHLTIPRFAIPFLMFSIITYTIIRVDGLYDEGLFLYPVTVVLAGLLLGKRGIFIYAVFIFVAVTIIGYAQIRGLITTPFNMHLSYGRLLLIQVMLGFMAVLLYVTVDNLTNSLGRARQLHAQVQQELAQRVHAERALQQAHDDLKARVDELAALNEITQTVASELDLQTVLDTVAEMMARLFRAQAALIGLLDTETVELKIVAHYSCQNVRPSLVGTIFALAETPFVVQTITTHQSLIIRQAQTNPLTTPTHPMLRERDVRGMLVVPLHIQGGSVGIVIITTNQAERAFTAAEVKLAETVAGQVAGAIRNAHLFEEIQQAKEAAETASRFKSTFLAGVSHELRTPLNGILGYTQLLAGDTTLTGHQKASVTVIQQSGERLLTLINNILRVSEAEAKRLALQPENYDVYHMFLPQETVPQNTPQNLPSLPSQETLSSQWQTQMHQALIEGDLEHVLSLIRQIREHHGALADQLTELADNFDYPALLGFIENMEEEI